MDYGTVLGIRNELWGGARGYGVRARGYGVRARGYGARARGYGARARGYGTLMILVSAPVPLGLIGF